MMQRNSANHSSRRALFWIVAVVANSTLLPSLAAADSPNPTIQVIAHRGASGYCIEHSEAAKVLAHALGAPYIEQDVVLTKDKVFVVSHDITMDATTNVASVYPNRARADGKFYFVDFTWDELRALSLVPRTVRAPKGTAIAAPSGPGTSCGQRIMKLEDEIQLIRSLDAARGKTTGLYIELKSPSFHAKEMNLSMGAELLEFLRAHSVSKDPAHCLIQCFEIEALESLHRDHQCPYALVALLGGKNADVPWERLKRFAYGVGPSLEMIASRKDGMVVTTGFVESARENGLRVHPYTVRTQSQPSWSSSLEETHRVLIKQLRVDGFFSDYPDLSIAAAH